MVKVQHHKYKSLHIKHQNLGIIHGEQQLGQKCFIVLVPEAEIEDDDDSKDKSKDSAPAAA